MSTVTPQDTAGWTPADGWSPREAPRPPRPRRYGVLKALGAAFTAVLVLGGAASMVPEMVERSEVTEIAWPEWGEGVEIARTNGDVLVSEGQPGVRLATRSAFVTPEHEVSRTASDDVQLSMQCGGGFFQRCVGDWDVVVPEGGPVTIGGSVGDVGVVDVSGDLTLRTSVGDIRVEASSSQDLDLTSSVGDIRVELSEAPRMLRATGSVGDITVVVPAGVAYNVLTTTAGAGEAIIEVDEDAASEHVLDLRTSVGTIRVTNG
ncbi:DUF4097 family beta strand repeat-containing protein [Ornithinimicrobium sp. Y1694]|uniref:DUF4097 family beta strand repeat-containing protein n=1 Tax=Ornithinimicrobium sp. Y1694 TaxID=3418590 RepID=UPI003CEAC4F1